MLKKFFPRTLAGMVVLSLLMMACETLPHQNDDFDSEQYQVALDQSGNDVIGLLNDGQFTQIISDAALNAIFQRITPETILETSLYPDAGNYYLKGVTNSTRWFLFLDLDPTSGVLKLNQRYLGCSGSDCKCILVSGTCDCPSSPVQNTNDCDPTSGSLSNSNN